MSESDKTSLAIAAYNAARAEIVERLKMRETLIRLYLIACLTFVGTSLANAASAEGFLLALVTPVVSLPIAIMVRQQKEAVELLAQFLREKVTDSLKELAVPTWDVFTKEDKDTERVKNRWTALGNLFGIHFITFCSVVFAWFKSWSRFQDERNWDVALVIPVTICAIIAACITFEFSLVRGRYQSKRPAGDLVVGERGIG